MDEKNVQKNGLNYFLAVKGQLPNTNKNHKTLWKKCKKGLTEICCRICSLTTAKYKENMKICDEIGQMIC